MKILLNFKTAPNKSSILAGTSLEALIYLSHFFEKFGRVLSQKNVVDRLEAWLNDQGIAFKSQILNETRIARRSVQEAAENICWHLEINGG